MADRRPNIVWFHVDNLGLGELGCYGGGKVRGAETRRIDQFSREGLQLWHYVTEPQCTPSRSALMTGRRAICSGTHTVALAGEAGGIVAWERTMRDVLISDPKEREPVNAQYFHTWVMGPVGQLLRRFQESVKREPLIPPGAPVDFVPRWHA